MQVVAASRDNAGDPYYTQRSMPDGSCQRSHSYLAWWCLPPVTPMVMHIQSFGLSLQHQLKTI